MIELDFEEEGGPCGIRRRGDGDGLLGGALKVELGVNSFVWSEAGIGLTFLAAFPFLAPISTASTFSPSSSTAAAAGSSLTVHLTTNPSTGCPSHSPLSSTPSVNFLTSSIVPRITSRVSMNPNSLAKEATALGGSVSNAGATFLLRPWRWRPVRSRE